MLPMTLVPLPYEAIAKKVIEEESAMFLRAFYPLPEQGDSDRVQHINDLVNGYARQLSERIMNRFMTPPAGGWLGE